MRALQPMPVPAQDAGRPMRGLSRIETQEALRLARQIAVGIEAAHTHGILHRDLKPANVKVTSEGQIKIRYGQTSLSNPR